MCTSVLHGRESQSLSIVRIVKLMLQTNTQQKPKILLSVITEVCMNCKALSFDMFSIQS